MARTRTHAATYDPRTVKENIVDTPLNEEMSTSFLEYAYSVIYARALPDARDGMKPVQRRIVYQMGEMGLTPQKPYMKSARVVGEVMGKLHPHGDSAIYEAMVRLAQPFAMRLPLVDGHGNFGSLDDGPAASRYTEARLAPSAFGMIDSIGEETVDFTPNYDNKLEEPAVLPAEFPNLLVNGASGIAVGMATNMATHNLREVVEGAQYLMRHPDASVDDLMRYIPGPDLPGGGIIMGRSGIRDAYETGRGTFTTRSTTHIENVTARKKAIIVTELPFMVGPEKVLERISEGVKNKKLDGISGAIDLTDRHNGTRLVIEIKTGFDPQAVLTQLFKYTPLEDNFTINNVALVDGRPHTMGLKELLEVWIAHRRDVIRKRSAYRKRKAEERLHLVEGLLLALLDIDEVIEVIRSSDDADAAKNRLMTVFDLDDIQAQYILDLRLRRLTRMSRIELETERDDLRRRIEELSEILGSAEKLDAVVVDSMNEAVAQWADARRTVLLDEGEDGSFSVVPAAESASGTSGEVQAGAGANGSDAGAFGAGAGAASAPNAAQSASSALASVNRQMEAQSALGSSRGAVSGEALELEDTPCVIALSASGLVARLPEAAWDAYFARTRETKRTAEDTFVSFIRSSTRATYGLITSQGRLVTAHTSDLPSVHFTPGDPSAALSVAGGVRADELLAGTESTEPIPGEHTVSVIALGEAQDSTESPVPLALGTRLGVVKRWNRESPTTMDSWSVMDVKDGDEILFAADAADDARLVFVSSDSSLLTYAASAVRAQGRNSAGMAGIKLADDQQVLSFSVIPAERLSWTAEDEEAGVSASGAVVLTVAGDKDALPGTDMGSAKITPLELYPTKGRATGGVRSQRFLRGQNTLIAATVTSWPPLATSDSGHPVALPDIDMRRDGSGTELSSAVTDVSRV
ncbi:DNA topoisomerase IV [Alloscardovia macacae]|uniref:DNA topoisomerase (ATP-hydrolyzing) n=1 Tax=Alloscardovia macacae TaxID=1160091 RepID=A0A1Y2T129_9BIFI|nr:DNA topoisomerase IV subunit A [Alloscardovia macacae]OTA27632.1 DNA topoisomerase IV [Alloscardovia macacae]OTA30278.1 DNA topoisomerase IV [Alloscardovia macacae]